MVDHLHYKWSVSFWNQDSVGNPNSWFQATQNQLWEWSARHRCFPFNVLLLKHTAGPNSSHQLLRVKQIKENYWCTAKCLMLNDKTIILSALIANIKMGWVFFPWKVIGPNVIKYKIWILTVYWASVCVISFTPV